jgi:hypothetical protein
MKLFRILLLLGLTFSVVRAQTVEDLMVTTALSTTGTDGAPWVYVVWDSGNSALFANRAFSVNVKAGTAATPGTYVRQAIVRRTIDQKLILSELTRAACLGDNLAQLDMLVTDALTPYVDVRPPTREGRLAALLARPEPNVQTQLLPILRRISPGAAMCMGQAWAGAVTAAPGQQVTVEVREYDDAAQIDRGVVGRTTVTVATHSPLPATGAPWQVPDRTATGDLNIRLRWPLPDSLLRRQTQLMGYHVWRAPLAFAQEMNWDVTPPTAAQLSTAGGGVKRLTPLPIRESKVFSAANVTDIGADPDTTFLEDDNNRYAPGGTTFSDGDRFLYFTVPHDLLSRPGIVSKAGEGLACRLLPPAVPRDLQITHRTTGGTGAGAGRQVLFLEWLQNVNAGNDQTDEYHVFSAPSVEAFAAGAPPLTPLATLPHTGAMKLSFEDATAYPEDQTQWFVVRAVHHGARGDVFSDAAPPVPGVRRGLSPATAPAPADTFTSGFCPRCVLTAPVFSTPPTPPGIEPWTIRLEITRQTADVAWVDVEDKLSTATDRTTRVYFPEGGDTLVHEWVAPPTPGNHPNFDLSIQAAGMDGTRSLTQTMKAGSTGSGTTVLVIAMQAALLDAGQIRSSNPLAAPLLGGAVALTNATAVLGGTGLVSSGIGAGVTTLPDGTDVLVQQGATDVGVSKVWRQRVVFASGPGSGYTARPIVVTDPVACARGFHSTRLGGGPKLNGILTGFYPPANTREFRLYRQVDSGELSLVRQGELPAAASGGSGANLVAVHDFALPPNAACLGYFVQMLDKSGNGSPLVRLGACIQAVAPLPVPTVGQPIFTGTPAAPRADLRWTCAAEGVEQFEVYIRPKTGTPMAEVPPGSQWVSSEPQTPAPPLRSYAEAAVGQVIVSPRDSASGQAKGRRLTTAYLSPRLGSGAAALGSGPLFTMDFGITAGVEYEVWIAALGPGTAARTTRGAFSEVITFRYLPPPPPPDPNCIVPWPYRDLPPVVTFHASLRAQRFVPTSSETASNVMGERPLWPVDHDSAPVGIKIGEVSVNSGRSTGGTIQGTGTPSDPTDDVLTLAFKGNAADDLNRAVYATAATSPESGQFLLPAVLYRQQVVSKDFAVVPGTVVQCSPKVGGLAYERLAGGNIRVRDPFLGLTGVNIASGSDLSPIAGAAPGTAKLYLHLLDTKPVLSGARYQYWLVRFQPDGEPAEVVDAGQVDVP